MNYTIRNVYPKDIADFLDNIHPEFSSICPFSKYSRYTSVSTQKLYNISGLEGIEDKSKNYRTFSYNSNIKTDFFEQFYRNLYEIKLLSEQGKPVNYIKLSLTCREDLTYKEEDFLDFAYRFLYPSKTFKTLVEEIKLDNIAIKEEELISILLQVTTTPGLTNEAIKNNNFLSYIYKKLEEDYKKL